MRDQGERDEISLGILPRVLGYHLNRTVSAVFKHFARTVTAAEDITPGLFGMLQVIAANPGLSQSSLAEIWEVDRSAIVKVVNKLAARGLVTRQPAPHDRRQWSLHLTPVGQAALARMEAVVIQHEQDIALGLTPEEQHTLITLLVRLRRQADPTPGGTL